MTSILVYNKEEMEGSVMNLKEPTNK